MNNQIKTIIFALALVLLISSSVLAYSLPDMKPVITLSASSNDTMAATVLTAVAVDSLTNAGIEKIELYEDNEFLESKTCDGQKTCIFSNTIVRNEIAEHVYYAKATDLGGNEKQSENITVKFNTFKTTNAPPIILDPKKVKVTFPLAGPLAGLAGCYNPDYSEETDQENFSVTKDRELEFETNIINLDNDALDYKWYITGPLGSLGPFSGSQSSPSITASALSSSSSILNTFNYVFNVSGNYAVKLVVEDSRGATAEKEWNILVENITAPPTIYGNIYDIDTGLPLEGINVSFYDSGVYDVNNDQGDYEALQPKSIPDVVTDKEGRYLFYGPLEELASYHAVFQGSKEVDFEIHGNKKNNQEKIILPETGVVKVFFEKASAFLKSDLYIESPNKQLLVGNSSVGEQVWLEEIGNGTELKFSILVHGGAMGLGDYKHYSNSTYCKIERLDNNTWRLYFEDLPSNKADWDYNDAVILVDLLAEVNESTVPDSDCDNDGIVNWEDSNDSACDLGEHDAEVSEKVPVTNFNAEGHIEYSGKYEGSNRYTLGDNVDFFMFGVNNGETNETITFNVQDHTIIGGPTAPIIYTGSISNPSESLTVNAGEKKHARFSFQLPSGLEEGRYDIHIIWKNDTWHKIGNFFIVNDTTPPEVWFDPEIYVCRPEASCPVLAGQESSFLYHTNDVAQEGTMKQIAMFVENITTNLDVSTQDNAGNAINISGVSGQIRVLNLGGNQVNISNLSGWPKDGHIKINYTDSGHYTLTIQVADKAGNTANASINVTVYANEAQVNSIGDAIYSLFGLLDFPMKHDFNYTVPTSRSVSVVWDRFTNEENYGDEYMTENDLSITAVGALEMRNYGKQAPPYAKPIYPMTEDEYNYTLSSFFTLIKCVPYTEPIGGSCSARNFAPEISSCNPGDGYYSYPCIPVDVAMSNSSSTQFNIGAVDPNNDAYTTYWYLDNVLVNSTSDSYLLVGNSSLIGNHTVKAVALDWSGENVSINKPGFGSHNSAEWNVVIN